MPTLKYFAYSVDIELRVWSYSSVGMSCDLIIFFVIGHKMVMVHFILNIDDVCLKLYTIFSKKPKCTLFAGSTVVDVKVKCM